MLPQIIYLILMGLGLGVSLSDHGKDKTGKHNFFVKFFATMLGLALLYWGGFFDILLN